jgi:hypothetical protein
MYNIYCDESCHLENDRQKAMVIGSIRVPRNFVKKISGDIKSIKEKHGISKYTEIKWVKVSPSKINFYLELINYFFENPLLSFRAIIIKDKQKLDHRFFNQTHDEWYYKMYYLMLRPIINEKNNHIYIDIKDTNGAEKIVRLRDFLCNSVHDFRREKISKIQLIRSEESQLLQLVDLLIGAISYVNRDLYTSNAKLEIVNFIKSRTGFNLKEKTYYTEQKFNLFTWEPQNSYRVI